MAQNRTEREGFRVLTFSDDPCSGNTRVPVHSVVLALSHHAPLCLTVGKPIEVQKTPHPSQEEVDRFHQHYMKELENLFKAHKLNVPRDQHLEICWKPPRGGAPQNAGLA